MTCSMTHSIHKAVGLDGGFLISSSAVISSPGDHCSLCQTMWGQQVWPSALRASITPHGGAENDGKDQSTEAYFTFLMEGASEAQHSSWP